VRSDAGHRLLSRKLRIEVVAGTAAGRVFELPGPEVRIGSGAGVDLVLDDRAVSRHHLTLRVEEAGLRVLDAGSRNGTVLDGIRVRDAYARPDSIIAAGGSTLKLRLVDDVIELPLSPRGRFGAMLGRSVAMRHIFAVLERVAPTETTVLVTGETGTGKELVAEALHEESPRAGGPFIVFDCSAVSANLIETELFGHLKGAFTGAVADRQGALEAADGGSLFLDEIGELPIDLQPKLLRALERREVRPVGSNKARRVDVRIIAATNRSLAAEVDRGRFREDLYYRLAVVTVTLPPLRERREDLPLLIDHFVRELSRGGNAGLPERVVDSFLERSWPGNVRELRNAVARALSLGGGAGPSGSPASTDPPVSAAAIDLSVPLKIARERVADDFERAYLEEALRRTGGNVSRAAEVAGVNRKFIQRAVRRWNLTSEPDSEA
jgi:transcriptional regulator with GAF, ATPase, and Fis domain